MASSRRELQYKILLIGDPAAGKSSIVSRYVHQVFSTGYKVTIGVDFSLKVLHYDDSTSVRLQIWDIGGQDKSGTMTRVYFKEARGALIVFDVTRPSTFESVQRWKADLDSKVFLPNGDHIPAVLLANKCDLANQKTLELLDKLDDYCQKNGFVGWFRTSAKEGYGIDDSVRKLLSKTIESDALEAPPTRNDAVNLAEAGSQSGGHCC